jgi:hypothetical protein
LAKIKLGDVGATVGKARTIGKSIGLLFDGLFFTAEMALKFVDGVKLFATKIVGAEKAVIMKMLRGPKTVSELAKLMARNPTMARLGIYSAAAMVGTLGAKGFVDFTTDFLSSPDVEPPAKREAIAAVVEKSDEIRRDVAQLDPANLGHLEQFIETLGVVANKSDGGLATVDFSPSITIREKKEIGAHAYNLSSLIAVNLEHLPEVLLELVFCIQNLEKLVQLRDEGELEK